MSAGIGDKGLKLSVIIVSYNVRYYLDQCLRSVQQAVQGLEAEVIVVDNASQDDSVRFLSAVFPWVTFIPVQENLGFAKANNMAIRKSKGEYVLLLNPDTLVGEEVLRDAVQFMETHPRSGGVGVRMLRTDGEDALESRRGVPTPMTSFYKMVGLCARYPSHRLFGKYYMGYLPWDKPSRIEIISGAFCMLRRRALDEIGLLDEDFFMYGEDIDLSFRLLQGGWENWYLPLKILHYKGESTQKTNFRYVHVFYEAMFIFIRKHYGHLSFFLSFPIRIGIYMKAGWALLSTMWKKVKIRLGMRSLNRTVRKHYLFDVDEDHREECRQLMEKHGLTATFVGVDIEWESFFHDDSEVLTYYVYDMAKFSFREILEHLSASRECDRQIAIYNPARRLLVTDSEILY